MAATKASQAREEERRAQNERRREVGGRGNDKPEYRFKTAGASDEFAVVLEFSPRADAASYEGTALGIARRLDSGLYELLSANPSAKSALKIDKPGEKSEVAGRLWSALCETLAREVREKDLALPVPESKSWDRFFQVYARTLLEFHNFDKVQEAFMERVRQNPKEAIESYAAGLVKEQHKRNLITQFQVDVMAKWPKAGEPGTAKQQLTHFKGVFDEMLRKAQDEFIKRAGWLGGSSNQIANALKIEELSAERDFIRDVLKKMCDAVRWSLGEEDSILV